MGSRRAAGEVDVDLAGARAGVGLLADEHDADLHGRRGACGERGTVEAGAEGVHGSGVAERAQRVEEGPCLSLVFG